MLSSTTPSEVAPGGGDSGDPRILTCSNLQCELGMGAQCGQRPPAQRIQEPQHCVLRSVGCAVTTCVLVFESYLGLLAARSSSQLGFFGCVLAEDRVDCAIVLGPITGAAAQYPYPLRSHIVGKSDDVIDAIARQLDVIGFSTP